MADIIGSGAEAVIYHDGEKVIKDRVSKSYRHEEIDRKLRKSRTRREAKVLEKLQEISFPGPKLLNVCDKSMKIDMEFVEGDKVRDVLDENIHYCEEIGEKIGKLHENHIIHADLTTSNMIVKDKIHFIDFGLSFISEKVEDKAVDLHLLDRALESKHHAIYPEAFELVIKGYKKASPSSELVLTRLETVKKRGRNKH